ncbi:DJ-1/PfpI family protein [Agrobacterium salinitolerans]|uniref:DJ-1/PfpI family protein n=1 Tax=Agrobacterium salinitolerans TaxID=1183413 RepID=A0A4Z1R431_9HYPH|nr:DJ-1/PfpI family protein [Agrobacterium salinitolerans]UYZ09264.1 DJ-1/PfpI family protein [Agrobacterium salinitolerans]
MSKRVIVFGGIAVVLLGLAGFGGWILSLPATTAAAEAPAVPQEETDAMLAALRYEGEGRPVIAVIGLNDATETNDYITTTGILRRADIADVVMLSTEEGPVQLYPALRVEPDAAIAAFDAEHPEGADYVIVPAMSRDDDPAVMAWLQDQSRKGATIIGVCAGAKVVGAAGLLNGKRATTHWYYLGEMLERNPTIEYVADRRMVADGNVVTTTGITAGMPMMLALIDAIAGPEKAEAVARDVGVEAWDMRHGSGAFKLTRPFATRVLANRMAFWNRDDWGIELEAGMDEVSLAMIADAWSRTYRSQAVTFAASPSAITTANGVRILPDRVENGWRQDRTASIYPGQRPADALDRTLEAITGRYGEPTTDVVALQLEYLRRR